MKTINARRISQVFFLVLFLWFCAVSVMGTRWWELRGWPVNWFLELDPLIGIATLLTTGKVYAGLAWGLFTLALTVTLGRVFCGWICPFGALHQFIGYLSRRKARLSEKLWDNLYRPAQSIKYYLLIYLLTLAVAALAVRWFTLPRSAPLISGVVAIVALLILAVTRSGKASPRSWVAGFVAVGFLWVLVSFVFRTDGGDAASLQIGLLDPIALMHRSINLIVLPLLDATHLKLSAARRLYEGSWLIGALFLAALLLNLYIPRFYCRFICPLGALLGVFGRHALWRIGKRSTDCPDCELCQENCEGACSPTDNIRVAECVMCLNCIDDCRHGLMTYRREPSATGEIVSPDLTRRGLVTTLIGGAVTVPVLGISAAAGTNWNPKLIRPPGSLDEAEFLSRCIKCGQCMRICPTNVLHPAGFEGGLEGLWTPKLNFRIGTSGCQQTCIACGNICPTAAIRPITLDERMGRGQFASAGPIRIGTAFVDRGRCLPWAMGRPCIVCQENCPVSPKAITTREVFEPVGNAKRLPVKFAGPAYIEFETDALVPDRLATGDYYCRINDDSDLKRYRIFRNSARFVEIDPSRAFDPIPAPGSRVDILIRLQQPYVNPEHCIGCGICEHECPVLGLRAIRVTADNESRNREHSLLL
jgi:polyferredoxin